MNDLGLEERYMRGPEAGPDWKWKGGGGSKGFID